MYIVVMMAGEMNVMLIVMTPAITLDLHELYFMDPNMLESK